MRPPVWNRKGFEMSELVVFGYDSEAKAEEARNGLYKLSKEYLVTIGDAVVATATPDGQIKLHQMVNLWAMGASSGAFWGLLAGILFFNPLIGVAAGAASGALAGALSDYGINDDFMRDVSSALQPGQAALFVLAERATSDRVIEAMATYGGTIIRTNLDRTQEQRLHEIFDHARKTVQAGQPPMSDDKTWSGGA
jgi:uncharacterized membrane protein